MEWFKNIFTEANNTTWCPVRVATALTGIIYHVLMVLGIFVGEIHVNVEFINSYLQQMTLFIGAGGLSVGVKSIMKADA